MPFTFSGNTAVSGLRDFGNDAASMILQTGATIEKGLHSMMTNRQVAALGQELGTLNPESPDWAQKAIQLGSRYPLAMKSPAGQFMLGTQAKANADWRRMQQVTAQGNAALSRQTQMENLRTQNDIKLEGIRHRNRMALGGGGVDLLGGGEAVVPESGRMQGMSGLGMLGRGLEMADAVPQEAPAELTGMSGLLPDISGDLAGLAAAQKVTGMKPTRAQVASAIASGQTRRQQEKMQEDRQRASEEGADRRAAEAEKSRVASEERSFRGMNAMTLRQERTNINSRINSIKRELDSDFDKELETIDTDDAGKPKGLSKEQTTYFRRRKALADELAALTAEYENATKELETLGGGSPSKTLRFDPATGKLVPR